METFRASDSQRCRGREAVALPSCNGTWQIHRSQVPLKSHIMQHQITHLKRHRFSRNRVHSTKLRRSKKYVNHVLISHHDSSSHHITPHHYLSQLVTQLPNSYSCGSHILFSCALRLNAPDPDIANPTHWSASRSHVTSMLAVVPQPRATHLHTDFAVGADDCDCDCDDDDRIVVVVAVVVVEGGVVVVGDWWWVTLQRCKKHKDPQRP